MINVLTIEREYGSGGNLIAAQLSEKLGWKLWDQSLTSEIARKLECPQRHVASHEERKDPLYYRLFKSFLRGSFEGSLNAPNLKLADAEGIRTATEKIVRNVAQDGNCVIVGRGSAYYLHTAPNAFHVFVYAPLEEKVRRLKEQGESEQDALRHAQGVDADRAAFIKQYFGVEWPPRPYFHLMINSTVGEDAAVETILNAMNILQTK